MSAFIHNEKQERAINLEHVDSIKKENRIRFEIVLGGTILFIQPKEIAALVVYLCSPLAVATNGSSLRVDGGVLHML